MRDKFVIPCSTTIWIASLCTNERRASVHMRHRVRAHDGGDQQDGTDDDGGLIGVKRDSRTLEYAHCVEDDGVDATELLVQHEEYAQEQGLPDCRVTRAANVVDGVPGSARSPRALQRPLQSMDDRFLFTKHLLNMDLRATVE